MVKIFAIMEWFPLLPMKSLNSRLGFPLAIAGALSVFVAAPSEAATFDFLSGPNTNASVLSFLDSGVNLQVSGSNGSGSNTVNNNTVNAPGSPPFQGLCAWAYVNGGIGRCGYGTATGGGVSEFQLKFDKTVAISSFNVSALDQLSGGTIMFSLSPSFTNPTTVSFSGTGNQTLASLFSVSPNQTIYVQTTGTYITNDASGGLIRLGSLTAIEQTPAPLPLLGAAVGFRLSRRMRKRIGSATLNA